MINTKHKIIEALEWRYAAKQMDATQSISEEDLHILKESIRLTPTSYGLQPFKALFIDNTEIREKLREKAWGQSQVTDASQLVVFVAQKSITPEDVDAYMMNVAQTRNVSDDAVKPFGDYIKKSIAPLSEEQFILWNTKQTYIALGMLLQTAAELKIDATPMEGFDPVGFDEILKLNELGLTSTIICALGYRHADDKNQFQAKVRKTQADLFLTI